MDPYWDEVRQAIDGVVAKVIQYGDDGIDLYFLNSPMNLQSVRSHQAVSQLFSQVRPIGASTPTEVKVEEILGPYVDAVEYAKKTGGHPVKNLNLIIITDGAADDPDTLNYALAGFAERLDLIHAPLTQLGIQFVQIGNDPEATEFLRSLDDELKQTHGLKRDMVDCTMYPGHITGDFIIKTLIGGINRRVDRGA
ncbi:hypothetical protein BT69DRAFT_1241024 [Atractiella rhizophila]|nr:hypothetical protein BT69DRAFT_1241024 [Atractiella rhizophila]